MKPKHDAVDKAWPIMNMPSSTSSASERQHFAHNMVTITHETPDHMMTPTNINASRSRNKSQSSFTTATPMFNGTLRGKLVSAFGHPSHQQGTIDGVGSLAESRPSGPGPSPGTGGAPLRSRRGCTQSSTDIGARVSLKRFHQEAAALSNLNHRYIATVHNFDTQDRRTDRRLVARCDAGFGTPHMGIIHLGSQLAEGLAVAHEHGVIHLDLKPGNVRVTPDARLKILDFGLATIVLGERSLTAETGSNEGPSVPTLRWRRSSCSEANSRLLPRFPDEGFLARRRDQGIHHARENHPSLRLRSAPECDNARAWVAWGPFWTASLGSIHGLSISLPFASEAVAARRGKCSSTDVY